MKPTDAKEDQVRPATFSKAVAVQPTDIQPTATPTVGIDTAERHGRSHDYRLQTYSVLLAAFLAMGYSTYQARQSATEARRLREAAEYADFSRERFAYVSDFDVWMAGYVYNIRSVSSAPATPQTYGQKIDSLYQQVMSIRRRYELDHVKIVKVFGEEAGRRHAELFTLTTTELFPTLADWLRVTAGYKALNGGDPATLGARTQEILVRMERVAGELRGQMFDDVRSDRPAPSMTEAPKNQHK